VISIVKSANQHPELEIVRAALDNRAGAAGGVAGNSYGTFCVTAKNCNLGKLLQLS
jgi:hypothetical protein